MTEKQIEEKAIAYARKVFLENNGVGGNGIDYNQFDVAAYMEGYKEAVFLMKPPLYNETYLGFGQWCAKNNLPKHTRNQLLFATFLIKNHGQLQRIGDLDKTFRTVRKWLKEFPQIPKNKNTVKRMRYALCR